MVPGDSFAKFLLMYSWLPLSAFFAFVAQNFLGGANRPQRTLVGAAMPSLAASVFIIGSSFLFQFGAAAQSAAGATMLAAIPLLILIAGYLGFLGSGWTRRSKIAVAVLLAYHAFIDLIFMAAAEL